MTATNHEIDAMDDVRMLIMARAQGPFGLETARRHSTLLMFRAMKQFQEGNVQGAIRLSTREMDFNTKAFGADHEYTRTSRLCLEALKQHYAKGAWRTACSSQQLQLKKQVSRVESNAPVVQPMPQVGISI